MSTPRIANSLRLGAAQGRHTIGFTLLYRRVSNPTYRSGSGRECWQSTLSAATLTAHARRPTSILQYGSARADQQPTPQAQRRTFLSWLRRRTSREEEDPFKQGRSKQPILSQDELFHPLSKSPIPAMRARGERVRSQAPCPYSLTKGQRKLVAYECPVSGWPTHAGRGEWELDTEKGKYMARLREANEDEHDLRSGRDIAEFKLPAHQGFEEVINFSSWDVYFYTRNHNSIETDRPRRHVTRLLTFPTTIAGALHENSPYTRRSMRLTHEGLRSMVALRQTLHPKLGEKPTLDVVRLIVVGARAESTLPPQVWDQLQYIFPGVAFHVFLIGPEAVPNQQKDSAYVTGPSQQPRKSRYGVPSSTVVVSRGLTITTLQAPYEDVHAQLEPFDPYTDVFFAFSPGFGFPSQLAVQEALRAKAEEREDEKKMKAARETYYAKSAQEEESRGETRSGSRSMPFRAAEGTPAPEGGEIPSAEPAPAMPGAADPGLTSVVSAPVVQAQAEWARAIGNILSTKCALIATGFSPADIERDVLAFESIEGVMGEFEWLITPGENTFASQQWVIADFDPRVAVKANWGIWAVRGKTYNINPRRASFMDRLEESAAEN